MLHLYYFESLLEQHGIRYGYKIGPNMMGICRGETGGPRTPMGPEPLSVRRGAEIARRADRGEAHEQFTQLRSSPER